MRDFTKKKLLILLTLIGISFSSYALNITVNGKATDASQGNGLPEVTVLEKGTRNGTVTGIDGEHLTCLTIKKNELYKI